MTRKRGQDFHFRKIRQCTTKISSALFTEGLITGTHMIYTQREEHYQHVSKEGKFQMKRVQKFTTWHC